MPTWCQLGKCRGGGERRWRTDEAAGSGSCANYLNSEGQVGHLPWTRHSRRSSPGGTAAPWRPAGCWQPSPAPPTEHSTTVPQCDSAQADLTLAAGLARAPCSIIQRAVQHFLPPSIPGLSSVVTSHLLFQERILISKVVLQYLSRWKEKKIPREPPRRINDTRPVPSARWPPSQTCNLPASRAPSMPRSLRQADGPHAITSTK